MEETLAENEVTLDLLESVFKGAHLPAGRTADGGLLIRHGGINTLVMVDAKWKRIMLFAILRFTIGCSDATALALINTLNARMILTRFALHRPRMLWCDHQSLYAGGITPLQIVRTYKRFVDVRRGTTRLVPPT